MQANRQQTCSIFGITRAEFDRLLPLGFPAQKKSSSRGEDWTVDTVEAHRWLLGVALTEAGLAAAGEGALDLEQERARLAAASATKIERENRVREGELLEADEVKAALVRCFASVNSRLGAMPATLAHKIRPDDPRTARRHLELAVEECRAELRALRIGTNAAA